MNAVIIGSSGLIGSFLLTQLLACERYTQVISLVRKPIALEHPKLKQLVVDFTDQHGWGDLINASIDDVFCCLGTTQKIAGGRDGFYMVDHDYVVNSAATLLGCGARQFLMISAYGSSAKSSSYYMKTKAETEADVSALGYASLHIFKPSLLTGPRAKRRGEKRLNEELGGVAMKLINPLLHGKLARTRSVPAQFVAAHMLDVASQNMSGTHEHFPSQEYAQR